MFCPNCGTDCGAYHFCPSCGTNLMPLQKTLPDEKSPEPEPKETGKRTGLSPEEIPFGKYEAGGFGWIAFQEDHLVIHRNYEPSKPFVTTIPYDKLTDVAFFRATLSKLGALAIRWTNNDYMPMPTRSQFDPTTLKFGAARNETFFKLYKAIKTAVDRNAIASGRPMPVYHCPKCQSVYVSARRRGYSVSRGVFGSFAAPGVGQILGNMGENDQMMECAECGHRWLIRRTNQTIPTD